MKGICTFCVFCALSFGAVVEVCAGTVMDVPELSHLPATSNTTSVVVPDVWQNTESILPTKEDKIWQQGTSASDLLRQKAAASKTQSKVPAAVGPHQEAAPEEQAEDEGVTLAGGAIQGEADVVGSSWTSPGSQEPVIDEDLMRRQHDVLGAYGQVVDEDDFSMSLGPELYIPGEGADVLGKSSSESSELGMGMKFQWGF